ncbi:MAG: hypothetical protein ACRDS0_07250 [Pseudonocardiaceae bacterium]
MVTMELMWWIVAIGVALPMVLAFMVGNCVETYRAKRLLRQVAIERRDIEESLRELEVGWDELEAGWHELEAEKADIRGGRKDNRRRASTLG